MVADQTYEESESIIMKNFLSMNFRLNRPKDFTGTCDKYLPKITQDLALLLRKTQKSLKYNPYGSQMAEPGN